MSMGPTEQSREDRVTLFTQFRQKVKMGAKKYFDRPLYYIFYTALPLLLLVLVFGVEVPYPFYIILALLALAQPETLSLLRKLKKKKYERK